MLGRWGVALLASVLLVGCGVARQTTGDPPPVRGGFTFIRSLQGEHATIWAVGDGADGGAPGRSVAALLAARHPARFLYLGDVYDDGTASQFKQNYATTYGHLRRITAPTPGNHDWPNHASGYDRYWRRALGRRASAWYAFRAGGWTLLSLNSEAPHDPGSPQHRWLLSKLRRPGTCRIAFWHRPRFSAGTHHGDQPDMAPIWDALRGHAAIVLSGHEHDMQRLKPIDAITEFVSGAGGHEHYPIDRRDHRLAFADDTHYGALRLRLSRGAASYAFVSDAGRVLDHGTLPCRP